MTAIALAYPHKLSCIMVEREHTRHLCPHDIEVGVAHDAAMDRSVGVLRDGHAHLATVAFPIYTESQAHDAVEPQLHAAARIRTGPTL